VANMSLLSKFSTLDYSYVKSEMQKGGHVDIFNVLGEYFISHEKCGHVLC